ncbi:5'-nucleotidase C-terminal domain-containing protein [Anaerobacillus isosaccharinicus]|uniref:5'-nucleotidase C-terminal domain-containing protein n=1 Tax=Anaerobacillus isosaccharinicus TaxID=1532552 RepID=A0A1S2L4J6_9BACI|nr:5'-nucleotidase C-terminal domain-containing protein [Anaerobacillus isosaccharinicus]MBA5584489.1 5'-nucleotidase C-terminal domain-containing protein [Anaerobacillus isosaccharinicus]QOY37127.1 5'-nucleotidase C-terminal domain-containing protein [Anaerobacillus isosaccharinicus]
MKKRLSLLLVILISLSTIFASTPMAEANNSYEVTRGEFIAELINTIGIDIMPYVESDSGFGDVSAELAPYVKVASNLGITNGIREGYFGANEKVTREQAYVFLIRALNLAKSYDDNILKSFQDADKVWAKQELTAAINLELLKGFEDKTLRPKQGLTTSQMTTILQRYHNNFERFSIVHSNDLHGRILYGERNGELGFAKIATIVDRVKEQYPNTFVLDMGDTFHGTNYVNFSEGTSAVEAMNLIGYDAMVAGNHDFNFGYERLLELQDLTDFPILSANVVVDADGELLLYSHLIVEEFGKKFALVGLTAVDTIVKTHPKNIEGLAFIDEVETMEFYLEALKDEVDHIVVLSHSGYDVDLDISNSVKGIDLILGGHSHTTIEKPELVNGTFITQAYEHGKALGITHMLFFKNELVGVHGHLERDHANLAERADVKNVIDQYKNAVDEVLSEVIGSVNVKLGGDRELVRTQETNLGNLVTDAMRELTGADIALTNGGGIRADIDSGEVTMNQVVAAFPFLNFVIAIELTGQDILNSLEHSVRSYPEQNGGFLHVSGLTFEFDPSKEVGKRVANVLVNGKSIDPAKKYSVATNDFLASGGDGYSWFTNGDLIVDTGELINEVVINFIQSGKTIPAVEGRIVKK